MRRRPAELVAPFAFVALACLVASTVACTKSDDTLQATNSTTTSPPATAPRSELGAALGAITPAATAEFMDESAKRTTDARTGRFALTMTVSDTPELGAGETTLLDLDVAYDRDADQSMGTMDISGLAKVTKSSNGVDLAKIFADPVNIVLDGKDEYLDSTAFESSFVVSTAWVHTSMTGTSSMGDLIKEFDVGSVGEFMGALRSAGTVKDVGHESVGGTKTTHYHVNIDLTALAKSGSTNSLTKLLGDTSAGGAAGLDVWIDDSGLVHRLEMVGQAGALGTDLGVVFTGGTAKIKVEFADVGKHQDIKVPSADDVSELNALKPKGQTKTSGNNSDWGTTTTSNTSNTSTTTTGADGWKH